MATFNISDLLAVRTMNVERKQQAQAIKEAPVLFAVVSRQVGGKVKTTHRQLYLATTEKLDVFQKAALVHAFPMAVSADRKSMDEMGKETKAELAAKTGLAGREWYWLANVDGMEPAAAKKLGEGAKGIALNAILYLNAATEQMLAEMTAPDDGDVPTQRVITMRNAEAEVEVEAEELFLG